MVVAADAAQMDSGRLARVEELFREQIERGLHPGAALAVYRYGWQVLDLYGGIADTDTGGPVSEDTIFVLYSSTKPMTGTCINLLKDRGKLDWDDPVAKHWPEFAQNGKGSITIRHILTHRGGFPTTPPELTWEVWRDWDAVVSALERATPTHEPGTVMAYHPFNFGWTIGELVRRIDGRPFSRFLREEVTGPLGMNDTYVGLPPELEGRVSRIHPMEDAGDQAVLAGTFNRPEVHQAVVPAGSGISTARDMARFFAMLERGGTLDAVRILTQETVAEVTRFHLEGMDMTSGNFTRRCLGMSLGDPRMGTDEAARASSFGHGGAGTSEVWGDRESGLAFAFIANGFRANETNDPRIVALSQAVRDACL